MYQGYSAKKTLGICACSSEQQQMYTHTQNKHMCYIRTASRVPGAPPLHFFSIVLEAKPSLRKISCTTSELSVPCLRTLRRWGGWERSSRGPGRPQTRQAHNSNSSQSACSPCRFLRGGGSGANVQHVVHACLIHVSSGRWRRL